MFLFAKSRFPLSSCAKKKKKKTATEGFDKLVLPFTRHSVTGGAAKQSIFGNGGLGGGSCFHPLEWNTHTHTWVHLTAGL